MHSRKEMINELRNLLSQKKSKEYYAKRLSTTVAHINDLMQEIQNPAEELSNTKRVNVEKGEIEIEGYWKTEPTPDEIMKSHKIDSKEYILSQYWSKQKSKGFQVSACFKKVKYTEENVLENKFIDFLQTYKPVSKFIPIPKTNRENTNACLIINNQDAHWNKYDTFGNNDMNVRFEDAYHRINKILNRATLEHNLDKIIYIVGSDSFNSEWTGNTTHNTPQHNILDYYQSFETICNYEVNVINILLNCSKEVEIVFVPGNHDQYVGWNLAKWLQAYYRNQENLFIDINPTFTKYLRYSNTALCFNHGYAQKAEQLAQNFPAEFRDFSLCDHHIIMAGDKHTEMSKTIGSIAYYRVGQTSKATSMWDAEKGYTDSKGKMTAFLIEEYNGLTDIIYK